MESSNWALRPSPKKCHEDCGTLQRKPENGIINKERRYDMIGYLSCFSFLFVSRPSIVSLATNSYCRHRHIDRQCRQFSISSSPPKSCNSRAIININYGKERQNATHLSMYSACSLSRYFFIEPLTFLHHTFLFLVLHLCILTCPS